MEPAERCTAVSAIVQANVNDNQWRREAMMPNEMKCEGCPLEKYNEGQCKCQEIPDVVEKPEASSICVNWLVSCWRKLIVRSEFPLVTEEGVRYTIRGNGVVSVDTTSLVKSNNFKEVLLKLQNL